VGWHRPGDDGESKGEMRDGLACLRFDEDVGLANFSKEGQRRRLQRATVMKSQMSDWSWAGISK
jgi:hypothetical protein